MYININVILYANAPINIFENNGKIQRNNSDIKIQFDAIKL